MALQLWFSSLWDRTAFNIKIYPKLVRVHSNLKSAFAIKPLHSLSRAEMHLQRPCGAPEASEEDRNPRIVRPMPKRYPEARWWLKPCCFPLSALLCQRQAQSQLWWPDCDRIVAIWIHGQQRSPGNSQPLPNTQNDVVPFSHTRMCKMFTFWVKSIQCLGIRARLASFAPVIVISIRKLNTVEKTST